jgi:hypothetical protein
MEKPWTLCEEFVKKETRKHHLSINTSQYLHTASVVCKHEDHKKKHIIGGRKMKKLISIAVMVIMAGVALSAEGQQESEFGQGLRNGTGRGAGVAAAGRGNGPGRAAAGQQGGSYGFDSRFTEDLKLVMTDAEGGDLSAEEREGLLFMWQEEKLARDVYQELYGTWNLPVFRNIAQSEQQHMESVDMLLDAYGLEKAGTDEAGVYGDKELNRLYADLTARGKTSVVESLKVGALIEDLDIHDLQQNLELTDNDDIRILYQNLMKGSRNHLRAFLRQLDREGIEYEARYISPEYLKKILSINRETAVIRDPEYAL